MRLVPASLFSIEWLTDIYNRARVDYLVPMGMRAEEMAGYIHVYDVALDASVVAMVGEQAVGLGMLGLRPGRAWITRLGVRPDYRGRGIGEAIVGHLLATAGRRGVERIVLEVVRENVAAHRLFVKWGFRETRELIVFRRPPGPPSSAPPARCVWVDREAALRLSRTRPAPISWVNETASLAHAAGLGGLIVVLPDGGRGWLVFQRQGDVLARLTFRTTAGDPPAVGRALLAHLHQAYPTAESHVENVAAANPHLPALYALGFVESFRRIEMYRHCTGGKVRPVPSRRFESDRATNRSGL